MVLAPDNVYHIFNQYGVGREVVGHQRPVTATDLELLPHVWRNLDKVIRGNKPNAIEMKKKTLGTTHVVGWDQWKDGVYVPTSMYIKRRR